MSGNTSIALIGAGLGGLGAALAFHAQGFSVTVYEQAATSERFAGAIMLSPNALRILDTYGVYERIKAKGHNFTYVDFQNTDGETTDRQILGSKEMFDYDALRIYRNAFRNELEAIVKAKGIEVQYGKKFTSIVAETASSVTFSFANGTTASSSLLIAADGIHSKVRSILVPGIVPLYQGILVVCGLVKRSDLNIPANATLDAPISQSSTAGSFLLAPQLADGTELLAGTQRRFPEQDRQGWEKIAADKGYQHKFLEEGMEYRSELMRSAIRNIPDDSLYIWALYTLPHLPSWTSNGGRVILIGDAAHAIPPTTGQGANQAFEDGYSLALLLKGLEKRDGKLEQGLKWWQSMREERVGRLLDLTRRLNNMRLPIQEQQKLSKEDLWKGGDAEAMRWLFEPKIEERVDE
jgi:2-polyprenyl-6-methoxyphenol hydroxylase-like FAD-dependent oxidoreductase